MTFSALSIPLAAGADWILTVGGSGPLDRQLLSTHAALPDGWLGIPVSGTDAARIAVKHGKVRLLEGLTYEWLVAGEGAERVAVSDPHFALQGASEWVVTGMVDEPARGRFRLVNFLGLAEVYFEVEGGIIVQRVEFISRKLDYDREYRAMTEEVAAFCSQLLLKWNAPTGLQFSQEPEQRKRILLEQFLFLRHFLSDRKFEAALEIIRNRPHSELVSQRNWVAADAACSPAFLSSPGTMTRDWRQFSSGGQTGRVPGEVLEVKKADSCNTAPNRFVKFALEQFASLCREVVSAGLEPECQAVVEARDMADRIRSALSLPLFRECGRLRRVPLESQVLQKREGYRDFLKAWLLVQSASRLQWDGRGDCYTGSSRNVDSLYEYWIFLTLHRMISGIKGMQLLPGQDTPEEGCEPFLSFPDGGLQVNLEKGKSSVAKFQYRSGESDSLFVHLYYERKFYRKGDGYSWSGMFQPDYSLVIFPASLESEKEAAKEGKLSFLHFDAKYRAEKISDVFGDWLKDKDSGGAEEHDRKHRPEDLLKMHTYNDAIRRTAGSYVFYPGTDDGKPRKPHRKFHEILPGVGAFILKPGNKSCETELVGFFTSVLEHHRDRFTQYRYLSDVTHETVVDKPRRVEEAGIGYSVMNPSAPCVLQWLKVEDAEVVREEGFAFCHAVYRDDPDRDQSKLQLDLATGIGSEFIPFGGGRSEKKTGHGWRAKITGVKFLTRQRLEAWLDERGSARKPSSDEVTHYLLIEFEEDGGFPVFDVTDLAKEKQSGSSYMAFSCVWQEVIDCPKAG